MFYKDIKNKILNSNYLQKNEFIKKKYIFTIVSLTKSKLKAMKKHFLLTLFIFFISLGYSNGLSVLNVSMTGQNTTDDYTLIEFDMTWDNSWRTSTFESNWDAAWIIAKYRKVNETIWHHATFHYVDGTGSGDGHTKPAGGELDSNDDTGTGGSHGVFLYSNADKAQSTANYTDIRLRWDYGADGLADDDSVEICVLGLEMVYVPTGSFELGDGDGGVESKYSFHTGTSTDNILIDNTLKGDIHVDLNTYDDAVLEGGSGIGIDGDGGIDTDDNGTIDNANFPTGYNAFYIMKYEMSHAQYVDFLNKITASQSLVRKYTAASSRNSIIGISSPNFYTNAENRAKNYINGDDWYAYGDWSALRPMTELEFEKAARGTVPAFTQEFAWGTNNIHNATYNISDDGLANAGIVNPGALTGNASYDITDGTLNGPLRCGIFAASAPNGGRKESGASYYGVMELSGNVSEPVIYLGNATQRNFDGSHGDGEIAANGKTDATWPTGRVVHKGGSFQYLYDFLRVSNRNYQYGTTSYTTRGLQYGARYVRTAP